MFLSMTVQKTGQAIKQLFMAIMKKVKSVKKSHSEK
jgi:hypothetical protein